MGSLIRTLLVLVILVIGGAYLLGYMPNTASLFSSSSTPAKAEPGVEAERTPPARPNLPSASDVKTRAVEAAQRMDETLADTALTTKIKAKIALDDTVKTSDVSVHTNDGVVTMKGTATSADAKTRLLALAKETQGVKSVVDQITVGR